MYAVVAAAAAVIIVIVLLLGGSSRRCGGGVGYGVRYDCLIPKCVCIYTLDIDINNNNKFLFLLISTKQDGKPINWVCFVWKRYTNITVRRNKSGCEVSLREFGDDEGAPYGRGNYVILY